MRLCSTLTDIACVELQQFIEHRYHTPKLCTERYRFNYILDHQNDDGNYTRLHEEDQKKTSLKICFIFIKVVAVDLFFSENVICLSQL